MALFSKKYKDDIRDDEVQLLGTVDPLSSIKKKRRNRTIIWTLVAVAALVALGLIFCLPRESQGEDVEGLFESSAEKEVADTLGASVVEKAFAERLDTTVNGHPLIIYIPHHATPRLYVGMPDEQAHRNSVLAFQAADIRADNKEILGEFVLAGRQLSRGIAKKGYCAIIDGKLTVAVGESTPLLSEAVATGGYFFRQYPLVDNGVAIVNKPKGKNIRKALCDRQGQIFVAVSANEETFPDFAQTLADLGVDNAIYMVGSAEAYGWAVDAEGNVDNFGHEEYLTEFENESYILWQ